MIRCGSPPISGDPDAVRSPPTAQALLPLASGSLVVEQRGVGAQHPLRPAPPEQPAQAREQDVLGVEDRERHPLRPRLRLDAELDQLGGVGVQSGVDALDVRRHELAALLAQGRVGSPGGLGDQGGSSEPVPRRRLRAEHLLGGAGRPAPQPLQLPGAVARGDLALAVREVGDRAGPDVRDAVLVAIDPGHVR